jgi:hypothetical protein
VTRRRSAADVGVARTGVPRLDITVMHVLRVCLEWSGSTAAAGPIFAGFVS